MWSKLLCRALHKTSADINNDDGKEDTSDEE